VKRYAAIDVGTNSVLLLVAERGDDGVFRPVLERAEITRLGRGVDRSRTLAPGAIDDTVEVLEDYAARARELGCEAIAATATSAARDATNGADFLRAAKERAGLTIEVISGDEEARLSFASATADFGAGRPLVVVDIGGGSTEFIYGEAGKIGYRKSFDVGSVRLTERMVKADPPSPEERAAIDAHLKGLWAELPAPLPGFALVGVAGTVTTVCAVARKIEPYDPAKVHGARLSLEELSAASALLAALPLWKRRAVPGLQPKRADVIVAGAQILEAAARRLGATEVIVSDRGLRWGLLADRFGAR
jgi:exopolyphosphatase/guanosine-5'-triphosphate,3'-diphosphate pyrophosphatase